MAKGTQVRKINQGNATQVWGRDNDDSQKEKQKPDSKTKREKKKKLNPD